jgi:hypothetical protein
MKQYDIDKYLYRIMFKGIVIKYGMSADKSKNYGERLYRQLSHAESWGSLRNCGSSGADWRVIEEEFFKLYGIKIDKNQISIKLWDVTNYPFTTIDPWKEVYYMEQSLIDSYANIVGEKPIGNLHDDINFRQKGHIPLEVYNGIFEEAKI